MQLYSYGEVGEPRQRRYRDDEECEAPGCLRRPESSGLCMSHYVTLVSGAKRRRMKAAAEGEATQKQKIARIMFYGAPCWICREPWEAVDHVKPISKGGSEWPGNLRPICTACNSKKRDKWPFDHPSMLNS